MCFVYKRAVIYFIVLRQKDLALLVTPNFITVLH